jgi:antitoxin component YwqK of YwqJK toxin-antitoxin module
MYSAKSTLVSALLGIGILPTSSLVAAGQTMSKLDCPPGTAPKSHTDACGTTITCVLVEQSLPIVDRFPVVEWFSSGKRRAQYSILSHGVRVGPFTGWHRNGARRIEGKYSPYQVQLPFDGLVTEWYPNGAKHAEVTLKAGALDGAARLWSSTSPARLRIEAYWKDGSPTGKWRTFFANGQPEIELNLKKGHYDGLVTIWAANGQKLEEFTRSSDGRQGPLRKWDPRGALLLEARYDKGELDGQFREFFSNGKKKTEAAYQEGKLAGPYTDWFESGQMKSSGAYVAGDTEGAWKTWHGSGQLESEIVYRKGQTQPGWKRYFPDGTLDERLGIDGAFEQFYPSGARQCTGTKGPAGRSGLWTWYDEQGQKVKAGNYSADWPDGDFSWFDRDGRVLVKHVFRDGVLTSIRCPKGSRKVVGLTGGPTRRVACYDSKGREHGMTYLFSQYGDGEYATRSYEHGEARPRCPVGVDPHFCEGSLTHPPFEVLLRQGIKAAPQKISASDDDRGRAPSLSQDTTQAFGRACEDDDTNRLETLAAFVPSGIEELAEVWNPSALTSPERAPDSR